jgi:two-component system NtrC family sensor kinase
MIKKSFVRRMMILFIVICLIPFFIFTSIFVNRTIGIEKERVEDSLSALVEEKASVLQKDLKNIENEAVNLAQWASYTMEETKDLRELSTEYGRNEEYVFERDKGEGQAKSNVFLPNDIELTPELTAEVINTEKMEGAMASIFQQNPDVTYTYLITANGLLRVYPYLDNDTFTPDHDQRSDYFYTRAVGVNNPERKAVWTNPYYDYGGNGWIITCSCPFYVNEKLGGVVCVDVSLKNLAGSIADFRLGNSGFAFVISEKGDVIYHPEMLDIISEMGDQFQINLLEQRNSPEGYQRIMKDMTSGKTGIETYYDGNHEEHMISFTPISALNWSIGIEVERSEYSVGASYLTMGFWGLLAVLLLICLLMAWILSRRVTQPIRNLTVDVQKMADGEFGQVRVTTEDEIGLLGDAFNLMSNEIKDYTTSLLYRKNQLETVFNSIGGVMMILKPDFSIVMMNREGLETLNANSGEEILGEKCYRLLRMEEEPCRNCPVKQTLENGSSNHREMIQNQNIYDVASYPVFENDKIEEVVVYRRKITEQVMMERELFQSEKMAGVGQMVAGVTHELKNPLAIIKGALYLIRANKDHPEKQEEAVKEIKASVSRAEKIIYNMLDFSKASRIEKELINAGSLLEQILLLVRQDFVKRRINVKIDLDENPIYLYGNGDSFKHIFLNIITNAIDAMPQGGDLHLSVKKIENDRTEIIISNTGEKIEDENLGKIFQPFFTTKENGTGLGLWIVAKEVSRNGGTIQAFNDGITRMGVVLPGKETDHEENLND